MEKGRQLYGWHKRRVIRTSMNVQYKSLLPFLCVGHSWKQPYFILSFTTLIFVNTKTSLITTLNLNICLWSSTNKKKVEKNGFNFPCNVSQGIKCFQSTQCSKVYLNACKNCHQHVTYHIIMKQKLIDISKRILFLGCNVTKIYFGKLDFDSASKYTFKKVFVVFI